MGENRCCMVPDESCPVSGTQVLHLLTPGRWKAGTIKAVEFMGSFYGET